jgi:hypothetical protein
MKIRTGFVSNSSSSSFTVPKGNLAVWQIEAIKDHISFANMMLGWPTEPKFDRWSVEEKSTTIEGYTSMDNFDMSAFMSAIGIDNADFGDAGWGCDVTPMQGTPRDEKESGFREFVSEEFSLDDLPFEIEYVGIGAIKGSTITLEEITSPDTEDCYFHFKLCWENAWPESHIITDGHRWALIRWPEGEVGRDQWGRRMETIEYKYPFIALDSYIKLHKMLIEYMGTRAQSLISEKIHEDS